MQMKWARRGQMWRPLSRHSRYPVLFQAAFGPGKITADRPVQAIAQFERTLYLCQLTL
jgi:cytochrome c peroxidase